MVRPWIERGTAEWLLLWSIFEHIGRKSSEPCECGEDWQYMGPAEKEGFHSFRHRCGFGHDARCCFDVKLEK